MVSTGIEVKVDIHSLLRQLVDYEASDLHLKAGSPPVFRIYGKLQPQTDSPPMNAAGLESVFYDVTTEEQRAQFLKGFSLDFAYSIAGVARFRVSAIRQRGSLSLAFRVVPHGIPSIDDLRLPNACRQLILKPRGLILVTGTAGSGKSTTLAAMIEYLNQNGSPKYYYY